MRTVLLSTFRSGGARLLAAGIAIAISVGFVVATLSAMDSFQSSVRTQLAGAYSGVGAVVEAQSLDDDQTQRALTALQGSEDVGTAQTNSTAFTRFEVDARNYSALARNLPSPDLRAEDLAYGRWPADRYETAIDEATAADLGLDIGDTVTARVYDDQTGQEVPGPQLQISGLYTGLGVNPLPNLLMRDDDLADMGSVSTSEIRVAGHAGAGDQELKDAVTAALQAAGVEASTLTQQEIIDQETERFFGDAAMLATIVLAFAVIALLVAALVIMNTFDVLIAQRTRQLALLRCLGSTSGQIRRLVLGEGALVGGLASLLGTAGGYGLSHLIAAVSARVPGLAALEPPVLRWWMVLLGVGLGLVVTLTSVSLPARKAMRTSPLMAMRPLEAVAPEPRTRLWTAIIGTLFFAGGIAGMVYALVSGQLLIAIPTAAITAIGLIILLRLVAAPLIAGLAGVVPGRWLPFRLAALNSRKHPGRTATTTIGMVIGVTIVTTMMVGAGLTQDSMSKQIDADRPVDMFVTGQESTPIDPQELSAVTGADGVAHAEAVPGTMAHVGDDEVLVLGVDEAVAQASRSDDTVPAPGTAAIGSALVDALGAEPESPVTLMVGDRHVEMTTTTDGVPWPAAILVPMDVLAELDPDAGIEQVWAQVEEGLSSAQLQTLASTVSGDTGLQAEVGPALERAMVGEIITTMLGVVLALLAVAILISVIGVANTLSLSVIERTRESSLLRALGLTRGQMRTMLACEAVQMTVVAAAIGILAGIGFGSVGVGALLAEIDVPLSFSLPWGQLALVVCAALVAGFLASVLPARRAAKLSPTVGLTAG